jgi:maleate isomerase
VTDPLSAALAAFAERGLRRVGIVSPYVASVSETVRRAFVAGGVEVPHMLSFGEEVEARVARIDPRSTAEAARALAWRGGMDALFLSCTNLRTYDILPALQAELGLPVLSSNQALAWHMARLAGIPCDRSGSAR